ncbi:MAG: purine-nucleoside phosphorylase [Firmicutes bacterium]|nr:purine-nucleoside phosphorylase [Bacillota bacterium]
MLDSKAYYERLLFYVEEIRKRTDFVPEVAIVLGSGLGDFAQNIEVEAEVRYGDLEGFPVSTAPGHAGQFIFGTLNGVKVVCMKGRIHYYEGYDMSEVVLPLRVMHLLGAETVIITNAVGCMNENFSVGSFMVVRDCIASFVPSPLIGPNIDELGPRFPDMSEIYSRDLISEVLKIGEEQGIEVNEGIFIQLTGPQYETASEIRMYKALGADCCGMSSAVEAITAAHMGMKVCGISCITNMCTGISKTKLSGEEVIEIANKVSGDFEKLVKKLVEKLGK